MTLTTTVAPPADVYGWDWTQTTHEGSAGVVDTLLAALDAHWIIPGKGFQGWSQSVEGFDGGGYSVGKVFFGGGREDVHVMATSDAAHQARYAVNWLDGVKTSRVDTRVDTLVAYEDLEGMLFTAGESYNTQVIRYESFRGKTPGRTLYLGAPSSAIRVRVYEKWRESPGEYPEGTNRVEVQLRPPSKAKERVTSWSPEETFCASKVTTELARLLGKDAHRAGTLHIKRPTPTLEQSLEAMGHQYGNAAKKWLTLSGGDVGKVLDYLTAERD